MSGPAPASKVSQQKVQQANKDVEDEQIRKIREQCICLTQAKCRTKVEKKKKPKNGKQKGSAVVCEEQMSDDEVDSVPNPHPHECLKNVGTKTHL